MKKLKTEEYSTRILSSNEKINICGGSAFFNDLMEDIGSIVGTIVDIVSNVESNRPVHDGTEISTLK